MKKITGILGIVLLSGIVLEHSIVNAEGLKANYQSNGSVVFEANTEPVEPVDPTDPTKPVDPVDPTDPNGPNPGTEGPLSIDFASSLDFGKNQITNKDETYYANAQTFKGANAGQYRANYVQISDHRGTNQGWTLTVAQNGQFKSDTAKDYKVLTGTQIKLSQSQLSSSMDETVKPPQINEIELDPNGNSSTVMSATTGAGVGTWVGYFGTVEEMTLNGETIQKNKAITLTIPGSTPKEAVDYRTTLTWSLIDVPGQ